MIENFVVRQCRTRECPRSFVSAGLLLFANLENKIRVECVQVAGGKEVTLINPGRLRELSKRMITPPPK